MLSFVYVSKEIFKQLSWMHTCVEYIWRQHCLGKDNLNNFKSLVNDDILANPTVHGWKCHGKVCIRTSSYFEQAAFNNNNNNHTMRTPSTSSAAKVVPKAITAAVVPAVNLRPAEGATTAVAAAVVPAVNLHPADGAANAVAAAVVPVVNQRPADGATAAVAAAVAAAVVPAVNLRPADGVAAAVVPAVPFNPRSRPCPCEHHLNDDFWKDDFGGKVPPEDWERLKACRAVSVCVAFTTFQKFAAEHDAANGVVAVVPPSRRGKPCMCKHTEDDDFWRDDFGGLVDPKSWAFLRQYREGSVCNAYGLFKKKAAKRRRTN
jgi:hypothetical protein